MNRDTSLAAAWYRAWLRRQPDVMNPARPPRDPDRDDDMGLGRVDPDAPVREPHYDGPIPDIARVTGTPARRLPRRITVIERRAYTFNLTNIVQSYSIPLSPVIDTRGWKSGLLAVRVHAVEPSPASASATVLVRTVDVSPDDPSIEFTASGAAPAACFVGGTAPRLETDALSSIGPAARVYLSVGMRTTTPTTTWSFTISVSLVGRF